MVGRGWLSRSPVHRVGQLRVSVLSHRSHRRGAVGGALAQRALLHRNSLLCLLLRNHFAGVELNQHGAVGFDFFDRHRKAEVVQEEELQLKVVELGKRQAADLNEIG